MPKPSKQLSQVAGQFKAQSVLSFLFHASTSLFNTCGQAVHSLSLRNRTTFVFVHGFILDTKVMHFLLNLSTTIPCFFTPTFPQQNSEYSSVKYSLYPSSTGLIITTTN